MCWSLSLVFFFWHYLQALSLVTAALGTTLEAGIVVITGLADVFQVLLSGAVTFPMEGGVTAGRPADIPEAGAVEWHIVGGFAGRPTATEVASFSSALVAATVKLMPALTSPV
jgi:hypothetical protein